MFARAYMGRKRRAQPLRTILLHLQETAAKSIRSRRELLTTVPVRNRFVYPGRRVGVTKRRTGYHQSPKLSQQAFGDIRGRSTPIARLPQLSTTREQPIPS
jgi:hypothetical protein